MCWCVHDSHHRMPLKSLKNHTSVCSSNHLTAISPQERLALYRKAVEDKSQPVLEVDDIRTVLTKNGDIDKKNEAASFLEELQRQRDLKRRRIAYRKRGAHTAKKNKTEVFLNKNFQHFKFIKLVTSFSENERFNRIDDGFFKGRLNDEFLWRNTFLTKSS